MADYVYVGRSRHRVKLAVYQVLTLGIYGRVWMYKLLREFDGHEALFLDRRPYLLLLLLPVIGPFFVKRKLATLLSDVVHHDVTTPGYRRRNALWLALIPLAPFYHLYVQRAVNHHWRMHTKEEELELKKAQLEQLQRRRSAEAQEEAKTLSREVAQRQKELEDLRSAALALREAEALRRQAEQEGGVRRSRLAAVKKLTNIPFLRRGPTTDAATEEGSPDTGAQEHDEEEEDEAPAPTTRGRGRRQAAPEPEPEPSDEAPSEPQATERSGGILSRLLRRTPKAGSDAAGETKDPKGSDKPSRKELRELRRKAKEERRAAKQAAKEEKRKAKEQRKADKRAATEARKEEKRRLKEERRKAAESAKAKGKKDAKKGGEKPKASSKKEKPAAKPAKGGKKRA